MEFDNIKLLIEGIRTEIVDLEHEANEAKNTGHHEASIIYEFSAMRFRVLLQRLGYAEPSKLVIEGEKAIVVKPAIQPAYFSVSMAESPFNKVVSYGH